eukprot:6475791-Amphidinium_carterae.1
MLVLMLDHKDALRLTSANRHCCFVIKSSTGTRITLVDHILNAALATVTGAPISNTISGMQRGRVALRSHACRWSPICMLALPASIAADGFKLPDTHKCHHSVVHLSLQPFVASALAR